MSLAFWHLLLLLLVANGTPVVVRNLLGTRFDTPLDMEFVLKGQPLFGHSKTWRGVLSSILVTSLVAFVLGYGFVAGVLVACYAMTGDLMSSFIKRRLNMPCSSMALFLDQIPESLLPAMAMHDTFSLDWLSVMILVIVFIIFELVLSRILFNLGIRKTPY